MVESIYNQHLMMYEKADFVPFPADAGRVIANLEAAYNQLVDANMQRDALPTSMFWQTKSGTDYLAVKRSSSDPGTTAGPRAPETERRLSDFKTLKDGLKAKITATNSLLADRAQQYRSLRLPVLPDRQGEILREIDRRGLLGNDLLVVGTNAFAAYEFACNARFPVGNEETEGFDLAWCRGTSVSLAPNCSNASTAESAVAFFRAEKHRRKLPDQQQEALPGCESGRLRGRASRRAKHPPIAA